MIKISLLILQIVRSANLLSHRFRENFGEVFYDYSENQRHSVNGESTLTSTKNVISTDRGVYFPLKDSTITLPPNEVSGSFSLPSTFSIVFWALVEDYSFYFLSFRSSTDIISIKRLAIQQNLSIQVKTSNFDSSDQTTSSSSFIYRNWNLIIFSVSNQLKLSVNKITYINLSLNEQLEFLGFSKCNLGLEYIQTSIIGYIFSFYITDAEESFDSYLSDPSDSCLIPGCQHCSYSVIDQGEIGCLPIVSSPYKDSTGEDCECSAGCNAGVCMNCEKCEEQTCQIAGASVQCKCPPGVLYNEEKCFCASGQFLNNDQCENCPDDCDECSSYELCTKCKANNAKTTKNGCVCIENYYNTTYLNTSNSCLKCEENCKTCDSSGKCLQCKDPYADLDNNCECFPGYYFSGSCRKCYGECRECTSYKKCTSCIAQNAFPSEIGCGCEEGFGSSNELNTLNSCFLCNSGCKSCNNQDTCLSCLDPNADPPFCTCKDGFFLNNTICAPCPNDCKKCNSDSCTECWDEYAQVNANNCTCPNGTYQIKSSSYTQCSTCRDDCKSCVDGLSCEECKIKGAIKKNIGCSCEEGYYSDSIECKKCENWDFDRRVCLFCDQNEYFYNGKCEVCEGLCEICDSIRCSKCIENAEIMNETCVCKNYYEERNSECRYTDFFVTINVKSYNSLNFWFSVPLNSTLQTQDFDFISSFSGYNLKITEKSKNEYLVSLKNLDFSQYGDAVIQFKGSVVSIFSQSLKETSFKVYFPESSKLLSEKKLENIYKSTTKSSFYATFAITAFLAIFNLDIIPIWSFLNSIQILIYIQLLNIKLTTRLSIILKGLSESTKLFNIFEYIIDTEYYIKLKGKWLDFGFKTSSILLNAGHLVTIFFLILVNMVIVFIIKKLEKFWPFSNEKVKKFIDTLWRKFHYNTFIRYIIQTYLDFGICSVLALPAIGNLNLPNIINLVFCIIISGCVGLIPFYTVYFTYKQKELIRSRNRQYFERFGSLFYEFSNDQSLMQSYFYLFFFCKRLFFIIILFSLYEFPQIQLYANISLSLSFLLYLFKYKPYSEKLITYANIVTEIIILFLFVLLAIYDIDTSLLNAEILDISFSAMVYSVFIAQTAAPMIIFFRKIVNKVREKCSKRKATRINLDVLEPNIYSDKLKFKYPKNRIYPWTKIDQNIT